MWFTTELPSQLFPWKLNRLPGGVLVFEEDEGFFNGEATRIIKNSNLKIPPKIVRLIEDLPGQSPISYKQFIKLDDIYLDELSSREIADFPKGTEYIKVPIRSGRLEKSFEWETNQDIP